MNDIINRLEELNTKVDQAYDLLDLLKRELELKNYEKEMADPKFWQDVATAQEVVRKHAKLEKTVKPWLELSRDIQDLKELAKLEANDLEGELGKQVDAAKSKLNELEFQLKFSQKYDAYDAVLTIQAGAGGTDAQDWVSMLQRMYVRWADKQGFKVEILDETPGDEAGLKQTTLMIEGSYVYGRLRSEHGVHRLVRLSPFNSAGSRETSFAMVEVVPHIDQPEELDLDEKDIKVDVYRAGGHGGQSVNTTDSAVRVTHLPTGIVVAIQNERSQIQNKETALKILRSKLAQLAQEQHVKKLSDLKGPNVEAAWGNQIRNYVMHPYTLVKDTRTSHQENDVTRVLDGDIDPFIEAYLLKT